MTAQLSLRCATPERDSSPRLGATVVGKSPSFQSSEKKRPGQRRKLLQIILLMEEIPNNHLGCIKPVVNNGINYQSQLVNAGFQPSTVCWCVFSFRNDNPKPHQPALCFTNIGFKKVREQHKKHSYLQSCILYIYICMTPYKEHIQL